MKLYLIRHGQVHNPQAILYGRLPGFGLSQLGKEQATQTAHALKNQPITTLYTSPLLRARQTAAIIGKELYLKPRVSSLLTESGSLPQGKPLAYFKTIERDLYAHHYVAQGQESLEDILRRMQQFIALVKNRHGQATVAAVSHGDPILILKAWYEKQPFTYEYKVANMIAVGSYITLTI